MNVSIRPSGDKAAAVAESVKSVRGSYRESNVPAFSRLESTMARAIVAIARSAAAATQIVRLLPPRMVDGSESEPRASTSVLDNSCSTFSRSIATSRIV